MRLPDLASYKTLYKETTCARCSVHPSQQLIFVPYRDQIGVVRLPARTGWHDDDNIKGWLMPVCGGCYGLFASVATNSQRQGWERMIRAIERWANDGLNREKSDGTD
jgi:hypothetical protein